VANIMKKQARCRYRTTPVLHLPAKIAKLLKLWRTISIKETIRNQVPTS